MRAFILFLFTILASLSAFAERAPRILMISPEHSGLLQTGGLAHAVTGLAQALKAEGYDVAALSPFYTEMPVPSTTSDTSKRYSVQLDWREGRSHKVSEFSLLTSAHHGLATYFLRHNNPPGHRNYFDNKSEGQTKKGYGPEETIGESIGAFALAATQLILDSHVDVVVLNDWTAGLIAPLLRDAEARGQKIPKIVFAIHNIAYQGLFPKSLVDFLGLDLRHYHTEGYEYWNQVNFLKAGIHYADMVYTVSGKYAQETTTSKYGMGLDGLMRRLMNAFRFTGILNGINQADWDPSRKHSDLNYAFSAKDLSGKAKGKAELQAMFELPIDPKIPVFVLTSRLAEQKGFEYLIDALSDAVESHQMQVLIIGDGETNYVARAQGLASRFPNKVKYSRFSPKLERIATAYGDFFMNAAWFEPSGLNQFFALANGTIPVVSGVGGLASSVRDGQNGFVFDIAESHDGKPYDAQATRRAIAETITRVVNVFNSDPHAIMKMRTAGMKEDNSWLSRVRSEFVPLIQYVMNNGADRIRAQRLTPAARIHSPRELAAMAGLPAPVAATVMTETRTLIDIRACSAAFAH